MTTTVMASKSGVLVPVLLDDEDARSIRGKLSVGSHGYVQAYIDRKVVLVHRWIMGCQKGDGKFVDHRNGDPLDNQRENLLVTTNSGNQGNLKRRAGHPRGVTKARSGRWRSQAKKDGRYYYLGTYSTVEEAAAVSHQWRVDNLPNYQVREA